SMLAARHKLVLNRIGRAVTITTGRRLAAHVADGHDDLVVMLDGHLACAELTGDWDIWWGANLGTADEQLVAGELGAVLPAVRAARDRARAARGWVMDTYLLRRRGASRPRRDGDHRPVDICADAHMIGAWLHTVTDTTTGTPMR